MSLGAYRATKAFAYPGWRLTVPGGPAGGHYKGFTHTQAAGTDILPQDQYEQDREDGMSSHDSAHTSPANPRGVYRSAAEVPPRPNASGAAMTYRGFQTARHPGTSISPGSFPADYFDTGEDQWIPEQGNVHGMGDLGLPIVAYGADGPAPPVLIRPWGATSVVNQPAPTLYPLPPAQAVTVPAAPPISPTPSPVIGTNEVIPLQDGSGNFYNLSTGGIVPPSQVTQNPATGQLIQAPAGSNWFSESTVFSGIPNWGVAIAAAGLLFAMMRPH